MREYFKIPVARNNALKRLVLIAALVLLPGVSWGLGWATSILQSGHSLSCNVSLGKSLVDRKDAIGALLSADLERVRAHHERLDQMNDAEFEQYILREVRSVAFCHPLTSDLVGVLPGTNYLASLDSATSVPSSLDRKISYGIWAYSAMYRSLRGFIRKAEARLPNMPEWDQKRYAGDIASAKRLLGKLKGLSIAELSKGEAGKRLSRWLQEEATRLGQGGELAGDLSELERASQDNSVLRKNMDSSDANDTSDNRGVPIKSPLNGALRPTVSTYTLEGQTLFIHEIQTVHLFFPSSLGPKNTCFERYVPNYPMFARFLTQGVAKPVATIELSQSESSELMKFFKSASKVKDASAFMLSDTSAVAQPTRSDSYSLSTCLSLVEETTSHTAHNDIVSSSESEALSASPWLTGRIVTFEAKDRLWQSLMAMLAAKRIENAQ